MTQRTGTATSAGKYLGLQLGGEFYAIQVQSVREIIERQQITRVPRTAPHVLGMINLRGKIVPVIDLRLKLGLPDDTPAERTRIVVVEVGGLRTGVVVDGVTDVLDIAPGQIEAPPHLGGGADVSYLLGIAKLHQKVFIVMDLDRVLSQEDVIQLGRLSGEENGEA